MPLKSPNAPLVLKFLVTLPDGGGSWVALGGGRGESAGVEDPLAPEVGLTGLQARPAWGPLANPAVARGTRRTHPLLLTAADGHRGGGRGAVPELGGLPGSQQAPGEPAGPLAGHARPRCWLLGPGASVSRRSPGRASLLYPPAVQEAELGAFPPLFPAQLTRGGFFSRAPPLCPPPSLPLELRGDFANSAPLRPRGQLGPAKAHLQRSRGTREGWLHPRRPPGTRYRTWDAAAGSGLDLPTALLSILMGLEG